MIKISQSTFILDLTPESFCRLAETLLETLEVLGLHNKALTLSQHKLFVYGVDFVIVDDDDDDDDDDIVDVDVDVDVGVDVPSV